MNEISTRQADDEVETHRGLHLLEITQKDESKADSVGAFLRAERLRRGEELRAIAMSLRIRRDQLEAMEEGNHRSLPGRAYAIGFVRSYAEYLGLDAADIVARYRVEYDRATGLTSELSFPKADAPRQLPKSVLLIVGVVVAVGLYGGWLLTRSADSLMAERIPPVPERVEASAVRTSDASAASTSVSSVVSGDMASAATSSHSAPNAAQSVYAPEPVAAPAEEVAAAAPQAELAQPEPVAAPQVQALPPLPSGQAFGAENVEGRVVVRARKSDAWIRVEDAKGKVLLERTLNPGDSYRAPNQPGVILVARDASAFEILVDGLSLGLAGPSSLVLTGKPLEPEALLAAAPPPVEPVAVVEGQAQPAQAPTAPVAAAPVTPGQ